MLEGAGEQSVEEGSLRRRCGGASDQRGRVEGLLEEAGQDEEVAAEALGRVPSAADEEGTKQGGEGGGGC